MGQFDTVDAPRQAGTILFYVEPPEDQQRAQRFEIIQGLLRADSGWIYAWKLGHSYRDFTTMDKLQPGCRVSFDVLAHQPYLATGLSFRNAEFRSDGDQRLAESNHPGLVKPARAARVLDPILAEMQADSDAVDAEAERNSIDSPEYLRLLRNLGLTARHFLRERRNLFPVVAIVALLCSACGSSSPTAPSTPPPVVVVPPPPVVVQTIQVSPCPTATVGVDLNFFREIGCNAFDTPIQPVRRWMVAPKLYLRTIDEAGAPIDALTLDTVQNAMLEIAPVWTAGHFGLDGVTRGTDTREGQTGWITVKWPATNAAAPSCGQSEVAIDGGWIALNYKVASCGCNGSAMRPRTARHELGHALGYWHTDSPADLMSGQQVAGCDASPSARELQAVAAQYR